MLNPSIAPAAISATASRAPHALQQPALHIQAARVLAHLVPSADRLRRVVLPQHLDAPPLGGQPLQARGIGPFGHHVPTLIGRIEQARIALDPPFLGHAQRRALGPRELALKSVLHPPHPFVVKLTATPPGSAETPAPEWPRPRHKPPATAAAPTAPAPPPAAPAAPASPSPATPKPAHAPPAGARARNQRARTHSAAAARPQPSASPGAKAGRPSKSRFSAAVRNSACATRTHCASRSADSADT